MITPTINKTEASTLLALVMQRLEDITDQTSPARRDECTKGELTALDNELAHLFTIAYRLEVIQNVD